MSAPVIFFWLLVGHSLADFALQPDAMAIGKNRHTPSATGVPWAYWLTSHALIHAGIVGIVTGSVTLAIIEFLLHWLIDFAKCDGLTEIHVDQSLHVVCKIMWAILA